MPAFTAPITANTVEFTPNIENNVATIANVAGGKATIWSTYGVKPCFQRHDVFTTNE